MAQEKLDLVRSILADWQLGDFSRAEWAHPEIEYTMIGTIEDGTWRGPAEMARVWGGWLKAWDDVHVALDALRDVDAERALVLLTTIGRGKTSRMELAQTRQGAVVFHVRE